MRVTRDDIDALVERIGEEFQPERVILFGSHAYGAPSSDSDVDLLVIMEHEGSGVAQALEIIRRIKSRLPIDILVRTPQEIRQRLAWNDFFLKEVVRRGEVIYESALSPPGENYERGRIRTTMLPVSTPSNAQRSI